MTTPRNGTLFHLTHVDNLASIVQDGLASDALVAQDGKQFVEAGNQRIKGRRRERRVPVEPFGVVADYAPFYFAARSPMLFAIHKGNVASYDGDQRELVYLVSSVQKLVELGLDFVCCDRNATLEVAEFRCGAEGLDELVDWRLMKGKFFNNTADEPDRIERRMAECLVHQRVPWSAMLGVAVYDEAMTGQVNAVFASVGVQGAEVHVRPQWYF